MIDESSYYPLFRRPLTPSNANPNRDKAAIALGSGVRATGPFISVALIWKLFKMLLSLKLAPLLPLTRTPDDVAMPVGVLPGLEAVQKKNSTVLATYNQYLVTAANVKGLVGVKV